MPKPYESFALLLDGDHIIKFSFLKIEIQEFSTIKGKRFCRLLPPHITNIQQLFSAYIGRYGVPRLLREIEKELLKTSSPSTV